MKSILRLTVLVLSMSAMAAEARADGFISPFVGVNFGGDAGGTLSNQFTDASKVTYGGQLGWMSKGIFGAELDFAYGNNFFDSTTDNNLWTLVPTAIIGIPIGGQTGPGIRPYATAGLGLSRRSLNFDGVDVFNGSDAVWTLGGGAMGYFSTHVGLRIDYRYLRNFSSDDFDFPEIPDFNNGTFDFSRFTGGLVFRF